jgi:hypothetical protein
MTAHDTFERSDNGYRFSVFIYMRCPHIFLLWLWCGRLVLQEGFASMTDIPALKKLLSEVRGVEIDSEEAHKILEAVPELIAAAEENERLRDRIKWLELKLSNTGGIIDDSEDGAL